MQSRPHGAAHVLLAVSELPNAGGFAGLDRVRGETLPENHLNAVALQATRCATVASAISAPHTH